jgi:hypothetical protein
VSAASGGAPARVRRSLVSVAAALSLAGLAWSLGAAPAQAMPKLIECQRPVRTGEEIYDLEHVDPATACPVVRALARWEYHPISHVRELYVCVGPGHHRPRLVLHSFEGWRITLAGAFRMSRGNSSFDVTGTDFPVNCT